MRKMKRIIILLWLCMCIGQLSADEYKVLSVNDASLKFTNGKTIRVGDVFSDEKDIVWEKERQAVKAINMTTKKHTQFVSKMRNRDKGPGVLERTIQASAHGGYEFQGMYNLLDSVEVNTDRDLSKGSYFQATYKYDDSIITKVLPHHHQTVILDKSLFNIDGKELEPRDVNVIIEFVDGVTGGVTFINEVALYIIPESLE